MKKQNRFALLAWSPLFAQADHQELEGIIVYWRMDLFTRKIFFCQYDGGLMIAFCWDH